MPSIIQSELLCTRLPIHLVHPQADLLGHSRKDWHKYTIGYVTRFKMWFESHTSQDSSHTQARTRVTTYTIWPNSYDSSHVCITLGDKYDGRIFFTDKSDIKNQALVFFQNQDCWNKGLPFSDGLVQLFFVLLSKLPSNKCISNGGQTIAALSFFS